MSFDVDPELNTQELIFELDELTLDDLELLEEMLEELDMEMGGGICC